MKRAGMPIDALIGEGYYLLGMAIGAWVAATGRWWVVAAYILLKSIWLAVKHRCRIDYTTWDDEFRGRRCARDHKDLDPLGRFLAQRPTSPVQKELN